jgi:nucleotide-binding universal stress UspA family protein
VIHRDFYTNVVDSLLRIAQDEKVGWIALESLAHSWESAIVGSVARALMKKADCPVWVIHQDRVAGLELPIRVAS